ncbi:hypothetical protein L4D76_21135 [Photobacterium sagamiensis]|uniref:hypothetical protein n=1 Tax=Photobacterium sagamiensis TaxID=2910241 RepID=UPI003D129345
MRFSKQHSAIKRLRQRLTSAATRRKRLSINTHRKTLWRQRTYIVAANIAS